MLTGMLKRVCRLPGIKAPFDALRVDSPAGVDGVLTDVHTRFNIPSTSSTAGRSFCSPTGAAAAVR